MLRIRSTHALRIRRPDTVFGPGIVQIDLKDAFVVVPRDTVVDLEDWVREDNTFKLADAAGFIEEIVIKPTTTVSKAKTQDAPESGSEVTDTGSTTEDAPDTTSQQQGGQDDTSGDAVTTGKKGKTATTGK